MSGADEAAAAAARETAGLKARILREPGLVLDDAELMRALIAASGGEQRNVVDLRGALAARLETRLARLERTHRSVIAAAYENLAGASQVHRAALSLLEQDTLAAYLRALLVEIPAMLAVDVARLCIEAEATPAALAGLEKGLAGLVVEMPPGAIAAYVALGEEPERDGVWLRPTPPEAELIYGEEAARARSEALIALDPAPGCGRAALAFAAEDADRFSPEHGVDFVAFFGGVVARTLAPRLGAA